jgi:hypothetical protein
MVKTWIFSSGGHAFTAVGVLLTQALRSRSLCSGIEASRRARILSPLVESSVLVLWHNQVTRRFCGEPPQTPCADSGCEPLPCTGSCPRLCLAFLVTLRPALDLVRPPGPSSQAYMSLHSSKAAQSFHARSSPAPTQIKPQPALAILGQELVHTMLSITHHPKSNHQPDLDALILTYLLSNHL